MELTTSVLSAWLERCAHAINARRDELTALDAAIGDADHGANLDRGFTAVAVQLPSLAHGDAGALLKSVGMTLISKVGGASGPLYGTGFRRAGAALEGHSSFDAAQLAAALRAFVGGIAQIGRSEPGQKTMLDALVPALDALDAALNEGTDLPVAMRRAAEAARQGAVATIPMLALRGRASYLGERSIGHQDPGATSAALLLAELATALES